MNCAVHNLNYILLLVHVARVSVPARYTACAKMVRTVLPIRDRKVSVLTGWLHWVCVSTCWFVPPQCGFSRSLYCDFRFNNWHNGRYPRV